MLEDKTILITGGTGSFGNTLVKRALQSKIKEIRVFSRDEKKQDDMRKHYSDNRLKFFLGDVRHEPSLVDALGGVDLVFHSAALKQVPSCEFYPMEAVRTNIIGTENVINVSAQQNVGKVVILSTDKAVYPINAMGISKALMEKVAVARARTIKNNNTTICITRYGNVMASRGSVIPLFINQIKSGKRLTITDPDMTRFMMSLAESVDLVLYAFDKGQQGDIFVQKASACTIGDLAKALQIIFNKDIHIDVIGTRHGEKIHETLVSREEMARAYDLKHHYRIPMDDRDLNYSKYLSEGEKTISESFDFTSECAYRLSVDETVQMLLSLDYIQKELGSNTLISEGF